MVTICRARTVLESYHSRRSGRSLLAVGRRGTLERVSEAVVVVPYDEEWPSLFRDVGSQLRHELRDVALRIDHVGSTSVPGLDSKPIIDIQVSVASSLPLDAFRLPLERAGLVHRPGAELTKRYSASDPEIDGRTSTSAGRARSTSSSRCCSATSCAATRAPRRPTRRSSTTLRRSSARQSSVTST